MTAATPKHRIRALTDAGRATLEGLCEDLVERCVDICKQTLEDARLDTPIGRLELARLTNRPCPIYRTPRTGARPPTMPSSS